MQTRALFVNLMQWLTLTIYFLCVYFNHINGIQYWRLLCVYLFYAIAVSLFALHGFYPIIHESYCMIHNPTAIDHGVVRGSWFISNSANIFTTEKSMSQMPFNANISSWQIIFSLLHKKVLKSTFIEVDIIVINNLYDIL